MRAIGWQREHSADSPCRKAFPSRLCGEVSPPGATPRGGPAYCAAASRLSGLLTLAISVPRRVHREKWAVARTLAQINQALQAGEADKALGLIASLPQGGAQSAEAQNLECRVRYTLQQWDAAVANCEQAVRLDGQNSNYHLWLGRALG